MKPQITRESVRRVGPAALLFALATVADAQTPTTPSLPPTAVRVDGKTEAPPPPPKVLADPDTRLYAPCMTPDDLPVASSSGPKYVRPPKAKVMTEEAAKADGYRPSAHKVSCD